MPNLGKFAASRRVARTIYLGSAPTGGAANRGLEDRRVKLGCVMPGESAAVFEDALRRLSAAATYLYQDGARYWYSTQPTVAKLAEDRAEQLKRNPDAVVHEIERRLRADLREKGDFKGVHSTPASGQDVADDLDARLVILGLHQPYSKEPGNQAESAARAILASRGSAPRLFQNALAFVAIDSVRLQDLDEAARPYLAWDSILAEATTLDLSPHQVKQAETQRASADATVTGRLSEAYQWLLVPAQTLPQSEVEWQAIKMSGQDPLAVRASKKLRGNEQLVTRFAGTLLRLEPDKIPLWRGGSVAIKQLVEDFARYVYLPRLQEPDVLLEAVRDGCALITWERDSFAYADSFDETASRYRGLRGGQQIRIADSQVGLLVRPEVARRQINAETAPPSIDTGPGLGGSPVPPGLGGQAAATVVEVPKLTRFHGSVRLNANRAGGNASRIAEEVIAHLAGLDGADVTVTLEIVAEACSGFPEKVVRPVTENSRTLKFEQQGFEKD